MMHFSDKGQDEMNQLASRRGPRRGTYVFQSNEQKNLVRWIPYYCECCDETLTELRVEVDGCEPTTILYGDAARATYAALLKARAPQERSL